MGSNKNKKKNKRTKESDEEPDYTIIKKKIIKKSECLIDDSEEDDNVFIKKKVKKKKSECLIDDSEDDDNVFMKKKVKKKKKNLIYDPDDNSSEYVAKVVGIIDRTSKRYDKKMEGTAPELLFGPMSMIKSMEEASYYILTQKKMEYKCQNCDMGPIWNGKLLRLLLDHINKQNDDYTLKNLRFLCPNCCVQLKGRDTIAEFTKKATKNTCLVCNRVMSAKKIEGGKCKVCIEIDSVRRTQSNDYQYIQYMQNNIDANFDVSNAGNSPLFKNTDPLDKELAVHNILALQHLANEKKKSKYKRPKKKDKNEDIGHNIKRPQNNNLDYSVPLLSQLLGRNKPNNNDNNNDDNNDNDNNNHINTDDMEYDFDNDNDYIREDNGQLEMVIEKDTKKSHGFIFDY